MLKDTLSGCGEIANLDDEFFGADDAWSPADELFAEVMAAAGQTDWDDQY